MISAGLDAQKIGVARNVEQRIAFLQVGNQARLTIVHQVESDDPWLAERYAHWLLKDCRLRGEWFAVDPQRAVRALNAAQTAIIEDAGAAAKRITGDRPVQDDWIVNSPPGWYSTSADVAMERRRRNAAICRLLLPTPTDPDAEYSNAQS